MAKPHPGKHLGWPGKGVALACGARGSATPLTQRARDPDLGGHRKYTVHFRSCMLAFQDDE